MKARSLSLLVVIFLAIQLAGCCSDPQIRKNQYSEKQSQRRAETELASAANSVSRSLSQLAEIERTYRPQKRMPSPVDPYMVGMGDVVSIDWSGPVKPLLKKIAKTANYKLTVLGIPPGIPILVSISAKNALLSDVLRDVNFQCGSKGKVVIYPGSKVIELRYTR